MSIQSRSQPVDSLQVNRIKALVDSIGDLGTIDSANKPHQGIFFPNGSQKSVLFKSKFWIGGRDQDDSLHLNGGQYLMEDFRPGPVADQYDASYEAKYKRVWRLDRDSLEYHDQNWGNSGYQVPQMIQEWPAHGDTSNGEAHRLARFRDHNNNGEYEPGMGDRPIMRGDRAIYFINNDLRDAQSGRPLGVEVHGMIYAFDCPSDPALANSIMIHYEVIDRSQTSYDSLMIGHFSDFDLGCSQDDHIGTDVERGIAFAYNADSSDEDCNNTPGYDSLPPAAGCVFLQGPELRANNTDDVWNGPGEGSVNGVGFGDGISDNEHWGMQHAYFFRSGPGPYGDPTTDQDHYNYMTGYWKDGTHTTYNPPYDPPNDASDTLTRFFFPWDTDPEYWATYGDTVPPLTEDSLGNSGSDRKTIASTGPNSLAPGDTLSLDMAYVIAQEPDSIGSNTAPVKVMKERVDSLRSYFLRDEVPCSDAGFSSVPEGRPRSLEARVYPNPSKGRFKVELEGMEEQKVQYDLYSMRGTHITGGTWHAGRTETLKLTPQESGIYFLRIEGRTGQEVLKLLKQ